MTVLETTRLQLSKLSNKDAGFILKLMNEHAFIRFIGDRQIRTLNDAQKYLTSGPIADYKRQGFGLYRVSLREYDTPIGICGLLKRDEIDDPDIGFAFLEDYWSQGYAYEAAERTLEHGRQELQMSRIVAVTDPVNKASIRLLLKLGFTYDSKVRMSDDPVDIDLYASE